MDSSTWVWRFGCRYEDCDQRITPVNPGDKVILRHQPAGSHITRDGSVHACYVQIVAIPSSKIPNKRL